MKNIKRIAAIICICVLVGMYIVTLIVSIFDKSASMSLFKGCVATTIFIPVVIYVYMLLHKYAMNRSKRKDYYSSNDSTKED